MFKVKCQRSVFSSKRQFKPAVEPKPEPIYEDDPEPEIIKPKKPSKYLPGEKLLRDLNRIEKKKKEKKKKKVISQEKLLNSIARVITAY